MIAGDANMKKAAEREALRAVIQQWNANRLDLFELSEPNEDLEFHGVMRFYFHDSGQRVATKCIRVASNATVTDVIETLIEKFRPDMRMLSVPEYALYVTHENRDERRLNPDEKPLLVQLNWHKDDREGRFLLKRIDDKTKMPSNTFQDSSFRRKLSKREKKQLKKQEKLRRMKSNGDAEEGSVAEKLYTELPETSFTRSISNPEAVMRRRRQQKLEKKLQQFRSKDGGPDTGGTLKIYGEALCGDVPYKTLLLSVGDTTTHVVKEMLSKYGLDKEDAHNYCLVQVNTGDPLGPSEYILDEDECPLAILMSHPSTSGSIMFHVRRRPADYHPRKRKKKPQQKWQRSDLDCRYEDGLPFFLELNPDGTEIMSGTAKRHILHPNVTEVGSERTGGPNLQLFGPNIQPRHCVIAHTDGLVTVTPCSRDAETYVNGLRIYETTILQPGAIVKFGRIHNFRFIDPSGEDRSRARQPEFGYDRLSKDDTANNITHSSNNLSNYETTFDVDGNVETISLKDMDSRSQRSIASSRDGNRVANYERYPRGNEPILPAVLEVREETEAAFLHAVIFDLDPNDPSFKFAPTYTLYLTARYRASTHYRPELTPTERAHRLTVMLARVASMIQHVIQERYSDTKSLSFWMANASELLHFLKCDRHISAFSIDAQDILMDSVQIAFRHLVSCHKSELASAMSNFLSERDDCPNTVLQILSSAMALLRRCRVNAALTIQLFSQLFHFINMMAFNKIVTSPSQPQGINYCSRAWGIRLKNRVAQIGAWAERQGLELAANCHLGRLTEAAYLLEAPKYSTNDLAQLSSTCLKLNSLQLRALLRGYQPQHDEPKLPLESIDNVVHVAENVADELARSDGREVKLEEDVELQLSFLLPDDGYSCDVVRGVPQGLTEFLQPLQAAGLCRMNVQPTSSGLWTIYMAEPNVNLRSPSAMSNRIQTAQQPLEIQTIRLHKSSSGMGLSIVAAKGAGQDRLGIYIKSVVAGGAADVDGRLQAGDQLLKVDGQSLVGITQEKAAEYLVRTGPILTLEVAKQGAIYHGLATLLSQPSPLMSRANKGQGRRNSELFEKRPVNAMPSSVSMMNLQTKSGELSGLARGLTRYPSYPKTFLDDPFIQPPSRILRCDFDDALAVKSRSRVVPRIVVNGPRESPYDNSDSSSNESESAEKSKIFSKIEKVKFVKGENEVRSEGAHLTKEEAEKCIQELKNIVADFEKCTMEATEDATNSRLNLDLTGVNSDSDDTDSLGYEYEPLTTSLTDLRHTAAPDHRSLVRKEWRNRHHASLEAIPRDTNNSMKKYKSLDLAPDVKELRKNFESLRKTDANCDHNKLKIVDHLDTGSGCVRRSEEPAASPSRVVIGAGRVAALAKHFANLGEAGLIRVGHAQTRLNGISDPVLNRMIGEAYVKADAETQTSVRSAPDLKMAEAEVQTQEIRPAESEDNLDYKYDYSLIYSLSRKKVGYSLGNLLGVSTESLEGKNRRPQKAEGGGAPQKKFPRDYIRKRKTKARDGFLDGKWHSEEVLSPRDAGTVVVGRPRRMSERDLPSRLHGEEHKKQLSPHAPIQSSKSVPSLHTGGQGPEPKQQEIFNPGYSRTSSTNSIPQSSLRSRSNQNLTDSRTAPSNNVPQHGGVGSLHPTQSTPSLHQPHHYPNQSGYSNQSMMYNSNNPGYQHDNVPAGYQGMMGAPPVSNSNNNNNNSSNNSHNGSGNMYPGSPANPGYVPNASIGSNSYSGPSQYGQYGQGPQGGGQYPAGSYVPGGQYPGGVQGGQYQGTPNNMMHHSQYPGTAANPYQGSPNSQYSGNSQSGQYPPPASTGYGYQTTPGGVHYQGGTPSAGPGPSYPPYQSPQGGYNVGNSQADNERFYQNLCVYRSQDGFNKKQMLSPDDRTPNNAAPAHRSPGSDMSRDRPSSAYIPPHSMPVQSAGMANRSQSSRDMLRQEAKFHEMTEEVRRRELRSGAPTSRPGVSFGPPPVAPKPFGEEYRESPPPPPPPANTHPLLQKNTSPDNRYQASLGEPPRGGYYPTSPVDRRQYPYTGTNPWEREEKEKEQARRREAARQWREQQINELSSISNRTPQQEEQLRALKLERDFEKRAEEAKQEDEDEGEDETAITESAERVQDLLRMAQQQNGPIIRPATGSIAQMKLEEVRRQHSQGQNMNLKLSPTKPVNVNDLRFENLSINGPSNYNGYFGEKANGSLPQSPDRGPSYQSTPQSNSGVLKAPVNPPTQPTKRVSFSDPNANPATNNSMSNINNNNVNNNNNNSLTNNNISNNMSAMEKIVEDPNNFINEAETLLNSPKTPEGAPSFTANTPGVIGAQEVYRDPRQRLLAEQKQNSTPKVPGPEKLSFKEKMKMFAMETGEDGTPRDKVKISRAQRDIDNIASPVNNK